MMLLFCLALHCQGQDGRYPNQSGTDTVRVVKE